MKVDLARFNRMASVPDATVLPATDAMAGTHGADGSALRDVREPDRRIGRLK